MQRLEPRVVIKFVTAAWLASLPRASFWVSARDSDGEDSKITENVERDMS